MSEQSGGKICIGVDVGGTFTDAVLTDGVRTWRAKAPTTPGRLGQGVLAATELAVGRRGTTLAELLPTVSRFGLGTTAVTNTLAARTGRQVGLLTTQGFEGMLPFAQGSRVVDDDGWLAAPAEIVARRRIAAIDERIDRQGDVIVPIDTAQVTEEVRRLVEDEGAEAIAVSYLWSFLNPVHETASVEAIAAAYPDLPVVAGAALHPAIREYERTTYAILNAYVSGALGGIEELEADLKALGLAVPLLLVHSAGGSITVGEARRQPLGLAASGPAAGVAAAVAVADLSGVANLVTCDMGGTSFDVSLVEDGEPARRTRGELMGVWTALSLIDVESIGAGGGSLGWIDARGMLRVGPRSAGAVPGPACYGRGGTEATVTDALVVLGFIDPARFLGGDFALDAAAAREACARLGEPLGLDAEETAWGVRQIALAGMVKATRSRLAALGLDPRTHAVLSFGGSGSLFTPDIAAALGAPRVIVPELASVLSAFGAATTDVRRERIHSVLATMPVDPMLVQKLMDELATGVYDDLAADGVATADRSLSFEADLRFSKQIYELQLPISDTKVDAGTLETLLEDFRNEYAKRYGKGSIVLGIPVELVSLRAIGIGRTVQATLSAPGGSVPEGTAAPVAGRRSVRVERGPSGVHDVTVYNGAELRPGHALGGPALVDGSDTTIWVPGSTSAHVDEHGTLVMEVGR
ncbi:MAG TPA: hydantoinase/oxoprolinase family protein [Acidimicrobiales bacterium]|nr:hydantoinase/oxoprolinase family protein [Acidimicrobiales bacterium]